MYTYICKNTGVIDCTMGDKKRAFSNKINFYKSAYNFLPI
jgi:hypothetical protein